jgi:hypothetical protein
VVSECYYSKFYKVDIKLGGLFQEKTLINSSKIRVLEVVSVGEKIDS